MVTDILAYAPVFVGIVIVVIWYLYKVLWGILKYCRGSRGGNEEEEMTESAEILDTRQRMGKVISVGQNLLL